MNRLALYVRAALWWLLPLAALAAIVGWETDWGRALSRRPLPPEPIVPQPAAVALLPEYAIAGGTAARTETVERTLFNPTRRPAPSAAQATTAQMKRGQFALTGTTVVEGKSTAFLREVAGNKSRRVRAGETINGMLVADVKPDRVKLTLGEESEELVLKVATNPRPTVQPVAAAAPPAPPAAGAPPGAAPAAAAPAQAQDAATLAERRRAARAAAAAGGGATAGAAGTTATPPAAGTTPGAPAAPAAAANPAWDQVNQRYRERGVTQGQGAVK